MNYYTIYVWMLKKELQRTTNNIENMTKTIENINILQDKNNKIIEKLKKEISKINTELTKYKEFVEGFGLDDIKYLDEIINLYLKNQSIYKYDNLFECLQTLFLSVNNINTFLSKNEFKDIDDLMAFILQHKEHNCSVNVELSVFDRTKKVTFNNGFFNKYFNKAKNNKLNNYTKKCKYGTCTNFIPNSYDYCYNHYNIEIKNTENKNNSLLDFNKAKNIFDKKEETYIQKYVSEMINNHLDDRIIYDIIKNNNEKQEYNRILYEKDLKIKELLKNQKVKPGPKPKNKKVQLDKSSSSTEQRKRYEKWNQVLEHKDILEKLVKKNKNTKTYNIRLKTNRSRIKLFSELLPIKFNNNELKELAEDDVINKTDSNDSRFFIKAEIYDKIYKNDIIFNSEYIFNTGLFDKITKKHNNIELLIHKLELLCKGVDIDIIKKIEDLPKIENMENKPLTGNVNEKCSYCNKCIYPSNMLSSIKIDNEYYWVCDPNKISLYNKIQMERKNNK